MKQITPRYYPQFHCIASACKDNCCRGGWQIGIDEETVSRYRALPGDFGDRLRASIDYTDEYCFKQIDHHCPFLDENNLCSIYQKLGPEYMGVVCDQFPRFTEYYGTEKETGIGLACEEASRIILGEQGTFTLIASEIEEDAYEDAEWDATLDASLKGIRELLWEWIEKASTVKDALCGILAVCDELQAYITDDDMEGLADYGRNLTLEQIVGAISDFKSVLNDKNSLSGSNFPNGNNSLIGSNSVNGNCPSFNPEASMASVWTAYEGTDALSNEWVNLVDRVWTELHPEAQDDTGKQIGSGSVVDYNANFSGHNTEAPAEFSNYNKKFPAYADTFLAKYDRPLRNLLSYYLFRYFREASYHHNVLGVAQFMASNLLSFMELNYLLRDKNTEDTFMSLIHLMSREIEYDPDNVEVIMENFLFDDIFRAENLIALIQRI